MNGNSNTAAYVILEETLRRALDEARELARKSPRSERDEGALMAYFTLIDWAKQQAIRMNVEFADRELAELDPYSLLREKAA